MSICIFVLFSKFAFVELPVSVRCDVMAHELPAQHIWTGFGFSFLLLPSIEKRRENKTKKHSTIPLVLAGSMYIPQIGIAPIWKLIDLQIKM